MVVAYYGKNLSNMGLDDDIVNWICLGLSVLKGYTPEQAFDAWEGEIKSYNMWTEDDKRFCVWGRRHGMSNREVAEALGRTIHNVSHCYNDNKDKEEYAGL